MTWNVENLFDVGDEDGPETQAQLTAKVESLRAVIDAQRPHVLALQEVGSENALARLQAASTMAMPYRAVAAPDERGIRVAFLSRRVLHDPRQIRPFPTGLLPIQVGDDPPGPDGPRTMNLMGRAALQVTVRANGRDVHLVTAHLKSKLLTFPGGFTPLDEDQRARFAAYALYRRSSEATTLRVHLDGLLAGAGRDKPVILLGDMNDEPEAATTLILNGPPGSEIGSVGFDQPDQGDGDRLWNTARLIPEPKRFTRLPRPARVDRPHLCQPLPRDRHPNSRSHNRDRRARDVLDRRQPQRADRRAGLRLCRRRRNVGFLSSVYPWPLRPFDRPHPVRGYFNDPRISGSSRAFHFGVDIVAPNGTPVHAVRGGVVHLQGPQALSVLDGDVSFGYWHVIPAVRDHQRVARHQLVGRVAAPWLHVHFAERRAGIYRDPLRPGALSPWRETTKPRVTEVVFSRHGRVLSPAAIFGPVDVIAEAHQMPARKVPPPWDGLPLTPARLRWRVRRGGRTVRPWHTPIDLRKELLPAEHFRRIYAPGTRQNRQGRPGLYRFYLAHTWSTTLLEDGRYRLEVEASDLRGNLGRLRLPFTITNEL